LVLAIVAAFVAGSIVTGTIAYADKDDNGNPFNGIAEQLEKISMADRALNRINKRKQENYFSN